LRSAPMSATGGDGVGAPNADGAIRRDAGAATATISADQRRLPPVLGRDPLLFEAVLMSTGADRVVGREEPSPRMRRRAAGQRERERLAGGEGAL
jgi:hypothetical protein